jgi:hypothetical protein
MNQQQRFCPSCDRDTLHVKGRKPLGCVPHVILSVLTLGLWIPIAILGVGIGNLANQVEPYLCQTCGRKNGRNERNEAPSEGGGSSGVSGFGCFLILLALLFVAVVVGEIAN